MLSEAMLAEYAMVEESSLADMQDMHVDLCTAHGKALKVALMGKGE